MLAALLGLLELRFFETWLRLAGVNDDILLLYLDGVVVRWLLLLALTNVVIRYYRFLVV